MLKNTVLRHARRLGKMRTLYGIKQYSQFSITSPWRRNDNNKLLILSNSSNNGQSGRIIVNGDSLLVRFSSSHESKVGTDGEKKLKETLFKSFPQATSIVVEDISGGCGSMYQIYIESAEFSGLSTVKQHLLVNTALKKEIKEMHGVRIQTAVPK